MNPSEDGKRIGLIAGDGRFPIIFADNVRRLGFTVSAIAHVGTTLPELESYVEHIHWLKIGQFGKALAALKARWRWPSGHARWELKRPMCLPPSVLISEP